MRRLIAFGLVLLLSLPAAAANAGRVKYAGGTVPGVNIGTVGTLDTTAETSLTFDYAGKKLLIPYASIESFDHSETVARHLGVLPTIVVGLIKARQRRHFFRISYRDSHRDPSRSLDSGANDVAQVVVFEVSKQMALPLQAVLVARTSHVAPPPHNDKSCHPCAGQD
jgi:hypothetical protein